MKYFFLISGALARRKTRTILTALSVLIAFLLFGVLQGINESVESGIVNTGNGRLWTASRTNAEAALPVSDLSQIKAIPGVRAVTYIGFFGGFFRDARHSLPAFAGEMESLAIVYPELNFTPAMLKEMKSIRTGALIGRPLAIKYGWKVGDKVPVGTTLWTNRQGENTWLFDIVGIFDAAPSFARSPPGSGFWLNYDYWDEARMYDNHRVQLFVERIADPRQSTAVGNAIDRLFENSPDETRTQTENAALQSQVKQLLDIDFIATSIVTAVMFTLLFVTGNTMMQSVRERAGELATLKTIGFSDYSIAALVISESIALTLLGCLMGLGLSAFAIRVVGSVLGATSLPLIVAFDAIVVAVFVALLSVAVPLIRMRRTSVTDALAGR